VRPIGVADRDLSPIWKRQDLGRSNRWLTIA
jgi:hypothetical protein